MPNLVVYVPQKLWNRLHELGLDDPKIDARMVSLGAIEKLVNGYSSSGSSVSGSGQTASLRVGPDSGSDEKARPSRVQIPPEDSDPHFKPDFK